MIRSRALRAFTLIELLVVIAIIGLLSSVVLASLNTARDKAKDAQHRAVLNQVRTALQLYYDDHGTYLVAGTGYGSTGSGFFTQQGGNYPKSVAQGLVDGGYLGSVPDGDYHTYMIYGGSGGLAVKACLFAKLESPTDADAASFDAALPSTATMVQGYGMATALCF